MSPANSKRFPKALVVNDDQDVSFRTYCRLNHAGYQTNTAFDGMERIPQATEQLPDAILLDF
ncbi:MAG: hypothetical protein P8L85_08765 [Rubripirellula sp.]|nr:hypothetical protein [Rubripirellula sp.]